MRYELAPPAAAAAALFLALFPVLSPGTPRPENILRVDAGRPAGTVSRYLTGSHFVYALEPDSLYRDERIAAWMRAAAVKIIRWPGGTAVNSYHWDDLNGIAFRSDTWDPAYRDGYRGKEGFMDLDEFIAFCRKVGAEPMVGVNIRSGKAWNQKERSLKEAGALIRHCRRKNYRVKFWYIGNEGYVSGFSPRRYAEAVDEYARVLKSVDPSVTIVGDWKFGPEEKRRYGQLLEIVGLSREIDIIEVHEKWGGPWGLASGRCFEEWKRERPLYNGTLQKYIRRFRSDMKARGRKVKLGMNEWGIGAGRLTPFQNGLVAADFLIALVRGGVETACYWNLNIGHPSTRILETAGGGRSLVRISPVGEVFKMVGAAGGKKLLPLGSPDPGVYGFAAEGPAGIDVYVLNKNEQAWEGAIGLDGLREGISGCRAFIYGAPGRVETEKWPPGRSGRRVKCRLPPLTFTRAVFTLTPDHGPRR